MIDVLIIGAGAAGMAAAVSLSGKEVVLLEKNPALGKKIYATGNGRCNITNAKAQDFRAVIEFLKSIGIEVHEEDEGRFYPDSESAADVVFAFEKAISSCGAKIITGKAVSWAEKTDNHFTVMCGSEKFESEKLIIATGGKAGPQYGTAGDGYQLAQSFGHTINKLAPILTGIECAGDFSRLKGTRAKACVRLYRKGECVFRERGEIQFAEYGLSGIVIFNASRLLVLDDETAFSDYEIHLDFGRGEDMESERYFREMIGRRKDIPNFKIKDILRSVLPESLARAVVERAAESVEACGEGGSHAADSAEVSDEGGSRGTEWSTETHTNSDLRREDGSQEVAELADAAAPEKHIKNFDPAGDASSLTEKGAIHIAEAASDYVLKVTGARGWKMAQATRGGVRLDEIDGETMQSKIVPGLFFAGEIIDYDGACGGFNLNNAWLSGIKAGKSAGKA